MAKLILFKTVSLYGQWFRCTLNCQSIYWMFHNLTHTNSHFPCMFGLYRIKTVKKSPLGFSARPILSSLLVPIHLLPGLDRLSFQCFTPLGFSDWGRTQPRASNLQGSQTKNRAIIIVHGRFLKILSRVFFPIFLWNIRLFPT